MISLVHTQTFLQRKLYKWFVNIKTFSQMLNLMCHGCRGAMDS